MIGSKGNAATIELSGAGYFYRKSLGIEQNTLNSFELDTIKEANLTITKILPKKGSDRMLVYLYKDPVIDRNRVIGLKEKLTLGTNDKGMFYASLPDGEYAVEAIDTVKKATLASGKPISLKFPLQ